MKFLHINEADKEWKSGGLRDFFMYKDLGVKEATEGKVIAHLVKANMPPDTGTGWHTHQLDFQLVFMRKGWAKFMYNGVETLVKAGDVVHQNPGITHWLFDYSPDMEYMEICSPAEFGSTPCDAPEGVKDPVPDTWEWTKSVDKAFDTDGIYG